MRDAYGGMKMAKKEKKTKKYRVRCGDETILVSATSQKKAIKLAMERKGWESQISCMEA